MKKIVATCLLVLATMAAAGCQGGKPSLVITPGPGPHGTVNLDFTAEGSFPKSMTRQRIMLIISKKGGSTSSPQFYDMHNGRAVANLKLDPGHYHVTAGIRIYINHGQGNVPKKFEGITKGESFTVTEGGGSVSIEDIQEGPE